MDKSEPQAPQRALRFEQGRFRGLLTFDVHAEPEALKRVASLLAELESSDLNEKPLKVLVAVAKSLLDHHSKFKAISSEFVDIRSYEKEQPKVVVQIAAETEDERTYARRLTKRVFGHALKLRDEYYGVRHTLGREPFGYRDGSDEPDGWQPIEELGAIDKVPSSSGSGGSWLLFQRCVHDLDRFYDKLDEKEQDAVVGRHRFGPQNTDPLPGSHIAVARAASGGTGKNSLLLRRSFTYGRYQEEGLIFLAVAARAEHLKKSLEAVSADRMSDFIEQNEGGLYFVPPTAAWLCDGKPVPSPAATRPAKEKPFYPENPLVLYEMTPKSLTFFRRVFHRHKDKFDELGELRPDLQLLGKGLAKLLYGAEIPQTSLLFRLLHALFISDTSLKAAGLDSTTAKFPDAELNRDLESIASARANYEKRKMELEDTRPKDPEVNSKLIKLQEGYERDIRETTQRVRAYLTLPDRLHRVLDDELGKQTLGDVVAEAIVNDAKTMHGRDPRELEELDNIIEICKAASAEARHLNQSVGRYMTFFC